MDGQEPTMRNIIHKWIVLLNIYIRYITAPKRKYFFKLKYGNIIVKKVSGGRLTDTYLYIMALNDPSWYCNKSHKNKAPSNWYCTPRLNAFPHITVWVYPSISLRGNFEELMARRGVPLEEIMVYEALRLKSFHAVDTANVSPIQLAAAGFYATDGGREVRCFSCGIRHGMHASQRHKTRCRHKNGLPSGNVTLRDCPLPSERSIISTRSRYPPITTDIDLHSPVSQPQPTDPRPTADTNHRVTDLTTEPDRLASFELASTERRHAPQRTPKAEESTVEDIQQLQESNLCKNCLEDAANIIFLPCGHLVACSMCAPALERCPVCWTHVQGTVRGK